MQADEQIRAAALCDCRAIGKFDEFVGVASEGDFVSGARELGSEFLRQKQGVSLLLKGTNPISRIDSAMTGIEADPRDGCAAARFGW